MNVRYFEGLLTYAHTPQSHTMLELARLLLSCWTGTALSL